MISKLVAWGEDRPQAIARMRRALREYEVIGIRTTVPFFQWMLAQDAFLAARVHTNLLDELLQQRRGEPFSEPNPSFEEVASIAATLAAMASRPEAAAPAHVPSAAGVGSWTMRARAEGLRG